jgi:hypothetical protein
MENQHQKIKGYRDLSQLEIDTINAAKKMAQDVGDLIIVFEGMSETDKRWVAIAKTDLQKGFMALVRSIAKPESF